MAQQLINLGAVANDGTGTSLRAGGEIINENFAELYEAVALGTGGQVPDGIVSGGQLAWVSGLQFIVSAATYFIDGTLYSAAEQAVTLDAAHATNPRIDVIALDTTGTLVKITGTAAAAPSEPDYDPSTQLKLSFVLVPALATDPSITVENIYLENTEWVSSTSGSGFNAASTNNPLAGTKTIEGTTVAANAYVQLQRSAAMALDAFTLLRLYIRSKASWNANRLLRVQFYASGVAKGAAVTIASGYWGFDSAITSGYQFLGIPMAQFQIPPGTLVNQLRITDVGGSIGFYIDNISMQSSGGSVGTGIVPAHTHTQVVSLLVTDPNGADLSTGDGKMYWPVPSTMNGWNLTAAAAVVTTVSSSGLPAIQIHNLTQTADMLTTKITIDVSEKHSKDATTPAVIDIANDDVATGDLLRVDVDVAGTGTKGLIVELQFTKP